MKARFNRIVPISDLQRRSRELVDQVRKTGKPVVVTPRGRPAAMLVHCDVYDGRLATFDEMTFPDWEVRLTRAKREIATRNLVAHEGVVAKLKRR